MKANHTQALDVAVKLREFLSARQITQSQLAALIGVSPAVISQFLQGKYAGNLTDLINKIVQLMNSYTRKDSRVKNKPFIETTVAKKIHTLITQTEAFSDDEGKIGLIVGDGGHGKSHCLRAFADTNKNTVYVELDDAMTPTLMFAEIAKALRLDPSGSLAAVSRRLISNLQNRHIIIMLDETSGLTVRQLNQLRQIIVVKCRCPLILAGNSDLLNTVMQPNTRRGYESLDQFTSRLMCILNLDEVASGRGGNDGLYTVDDVKNLYEYGGIKLTSSAVKTLKKICMTPRSGRLRTCSHIIAALHTANVICQGGQIDAEHIIAAIEQLDLPVKVRLPLATGLETDEQEESVAMAKTA